MHYNTEFSNRSYIVKLAGYLKGVFKAIEYFVKELVGIRQLKPTFNGTDPWMPQFLIDQLPMRWGPEEEFKMGTKMLASNLK